MVAKNGLHCCKILQKVWYICTHKKNTQHAHRLLQLLPVPPALFYLYTLDFVTDLPPAQSFNCILTVIDHLTSLYISYPIPGEDKLAAAQVAKLVFDNIVMFFEVPKKLGHDRDSKFTAQF